MRNDRRPDTAEMTLALLAWRYAAGELPPDLAAEFETAKVDSRGDGAAAAAGRDDPARRAAGVADGLVWRRPVPGIRDDHREVGAHA